MKPTKKSLSIRFPRFWSDAASLEELEGTRLAGVRLRIVENFDTATSFATQSIIARSDLVTLCLFGWVVFLLKN